MIKAELLELIGWIATGVAMVGTVINARGKKVCFYFWGVSNTIFIIINLNIPNYPQATLFTFNMATCIYGLYRWSKNNTIMKNEIGDWLKGKIAPVINKARAHFGLPTIPSQSIGERDEHD